MFLTQRISIIKKLVSPKEDMRGIALFRQDKFGKESLEISQVYLDLAQVYYKKKELDEAITKSNIIQSRIFIIILLFIIIKICLSTSWSVHNHIL